MSFSVLSVIGCLGVLYLALSSVSIIGPDYVSYQIAVASGWRQEFWVEPLSWFLLVATQDTVSLHVVSFFIHGGLVIVSLYVAGSPSFPKLRQKILLSLFVASSPLVLMVAMSALRQGMGLVFLLISLGALFRRKNFSCLIWLGFAAACHRFNWVFLPPLLMSMLWSMNRWRSHGLYVFFLSAYGVAIAVLVPIKELKTDDNTLLYGIVVLTIGLLIALARVAPEVRRIGLVMLALPLCFVGSPDYFERVALGILVCATPMIYGSLRTRFNFKSAFLLISTATLCSVPMFLWILSRFPQIA